MSSPLIQAQGLVKRYRGREVVQGIDLEIRQGEILAVIGPNGAGKSTTLSMLLGIVKPDCGSVAYWREDYRSRIGVQLQTTPFFEGYSAEENLRLFGALYGVKLSRSELKAKLAACGLSEAGRVPAAKLSLGQQKRLAIAVTAVHRPDLIVLDEPAAGLDPRAGREIRSLIADLAAEGRTVVFSSHDMEEVERLAGRVVLIDRGRIAAQGRPADLLEEHGLIDMESLYLRLTERNQQEAI